VSGAGKCPPEPTTPGCQRDTDNAMGGLIDKIDDKVVDMIMDKLQGGGCQSGGSFQDMLHQAIKDVVRDQMGGTEGGGQSDAGGAANNDDSGGSNCTRTEGDSSTGDAQTNVAYSNAENDSDKKKCGTEGNWLVALAEVQKKFLSAAMKNMDTMKGNGSAAISGGDSKDKSAQEKQRNAFLEAQSQSQYQANMQMFNMVANMTSTLIKTLGEGLASIVRKQ
jgi:hypothetical protein